MKILKQKTNLELNKLPNVAIDKENKMNILSENKVYPCIIKVKGNKIISYAFQSPHNPSAFSDLANIMENQKDFPGKSPYQKM